MSWRGHDRRREHYGEQHKVALFPELHRLLKLITDMDSDAHPGLMTWQQMRRQAHLDAVALLAKIPKDLR